MKEVYKKLYKKYFNASFAERAVIIEAGVYLFVITASAKSWWQNTRAGRLFFKKDSIAFAINGISVNGQVKSKRLRANDLWNGNILKEHDHSVYVFCFLREGEAAYSFNLSGKPYIDSLQIYHIPDKEIALADITPSKRDRAPWQTFIGHGDIAFSFISVSARAEKNAVGRDDDDLQMRIDGTIVKNINNTSHKDWYWCGKILKGKPNTMERTFEYQAYPRRIELWADEAPTIKTLVIRVERVFFGAVALYPDIVNVKTVNLRAEPNTSSSVIATISNKERVALLEERVIGEWISARSYLWHKVRWNEMEGYILSSFIEIDGQSRKEAVNIIKEKSKEFHIEEDIVLALAECESLYKPFATSQAFEKKDGDGDPIAAKGIFQLTKSAVQQLEKNKGQYHFTIQDVFDMRQNIDAGIRYLAWLYTAYYKGTVQAYEKLIAAYNAGQGWIPVHGQLTYEHIPTAQKQEEAKHHVQCFLKKKQIKAWRTLFLIVFFSAVFPSSALGVQYLDEHDFFEPTVSKQEALRARISSYPDVVFDEEYNDLVFFDSKEKEVKRFSVSRFLNERARIPSGEQQGDVIFLGRDVVEYPKHTFYFSLTTLESCGTANCDWVVLRYDVPRSNITVIARDGLGSEPNFFLSPKGGNMIIKTDFSAGMCNAGLYLDVLDTERLTIAPIAGFNDSVYTASFLDTMQWESNDEIVFTVAYACDNDGNKDGKDRMFTFNVITNEIRVISEKYNPLDG